MNTTANQGWDKKMLQGRIAKLATHMTQHDTECGGIFTEHQVPSAPTTSSSSQKHPTLERQQSMEAKDVEAEGTNGTPILETFNKKV